MSSINMKRAQNRTEGRGQVQLLFWIVWNVGYHQPKKENDKAFVKVQISICFSHSHFLLLLESSPTCSLVHVITEVPEQSKLSSPSQKRTTGENLNVFIKTIVTAEPQQQLKRDGEIVCPVYCCLFQWSPTTDSFSQAMNSFQEFSQHEGKGEN